MPIPLHAWWTTRMRSHFCTSFAFPFLLILLLFSGCSLAAPAPQKKLTLFYTTDIHGHIIADDTTIGLDQVGGLAASTPNALLLDSGDFLQGTPLANLSQGRDIIRLMKMAGYFAVAVGNHEFDYGRDTALLRSHEALQSPHVMHVLSSNVVDEQGAFLFEEFAAITVDGVRLCMFGLSPTSTARQTRKGNVAGVIFTDPLSAASETARKLKNQDCDIVIALSHLGSTNRSQANSTDLLRECPLVDIILDGHSHVILEKKAGESRIAVSPGAHGKHLGKLDIRYDTLSKTITSLANTLLPPSPDLPVVPELNRALEQLVTEQNAVLGIPVRDLDHDIPGGTNFVRLQSSGIGNLCADALRDATKADMALVNGGGIRGGFKKGTITRKDIVTVLPFRDPVYTVTLTGDELRLVLEHGLAALPLPEGRFPQISGIQVAADPQAAPGERVVFLTLDDGSPVQASAVYSLAISGFLADGGDGYPLLAERPRVAEFLPAAELLELYLIGIDPALYTGTVQLRVVFVRPLPDPAAEQRDGVGGEYRR